MEDTPYVFKESLDAGLAHFLSLYFALSALP
jgi:hypothetical protein